MNEPIDRNGPGIMPVFEPRDAVLQRLAERYEHFATKEQEARIKGQDVVAEGAHQYALWILRAYQAESA